jgi:small subunit ribosomal protein S9
MAASTNHYVYAIGRRKSATARVRLVPGKGNITVNGKLAAEYYSDSKFLLGKLDEPFSALGEANKYDISAVVSGGGHDGQIEAIRLAISKALTMIDENVKGTLKRAKLLSRDPRDKERKKFGLKGARKQRQFTKR